MISKRDQSLRDYVDHFQQEHLKLVQMGFMLIDKLDAQPEKRGEEMAQFINLLLGHFDREEGVMKQCHYPIQKQKIHLNIHEEMIRSAISIYKKIETGIEFDLCYRDLEALLVMMEEHLVLYDQNHTMFISELFDQIRFDQKK